MSWKAPPIKKLDKEALEAVRATNEARIARYLPPILVKIRKCESCGGLFETISDKTCGCLRVLEGGKI